MNETVEAPKHRGRSLAMQLRWGFWSALVLILTVCAMAWWIALGYREEVESSYAVRLKTAVQLAEADSALWELRYGFPQYMVGNDQEKESILAAEEGLYARIEGRLATYGEVVSDPEERAALESLKATYLRYKQVRPKFFSLWNAGREEEAIAWRALTTSPYGAAAVQAFGEQLKLQRQVSERQYASSSQKVSLALDLVSVMTAMLLAMLVAGYVYLLRVLQPLRVLRQRAEQAVQEQLGEEVGVSSHANEVDALVESFDLMSKRLVSHALALRQSGDRLDFLLRSTPAIIYAAEADGDYGATFISENVQKQMGYTPRDFTGDPAFWVNHIHPEDRDRVLRELTALATMDNYSHEYRFQTKNGSWRWMLDEVSVIRDEAGKPQEIVGYWLDITQRKQVEQALMAARREAEKASRAKGEFLANMSHELRTPLNAVIGFADLLLMDNSLSEQAKNHAKEIEGAGAHLLTLVNDLIDLSRIDAGKLDISMEAVALCAVAEESLALLAPLAAERNVKIKPLLGRDDSPYGDCTTLLVKADRGRLRQVLINLIANAIKYNRENGSVMISCSPGIERTRINIVDTGPGIALDKQTRLFTAFDRLGHEAGSVAGSGIGLTISKRIIEAMGGSIGFSSVENQGSTFWVELPTFVPRETPSSSMIASLGDTLADTLKSHEGVGQVLYVEDNPMNQRLMQSYFAKYTGLTLLEASTAETGIELAKTTPLSLILMDINLPNMNGYTALKVLQSDPTTANIPVIAVTANAMSGDRQRCLDAGFVDYLSKPVKMSSLHEALDKVLKKP